ncbi:hypothetical protein [Mangrovicella endophytica]|uniref:hypothetical protein n=1 Tax=Mangrovicella endophytica TaxID=2066697 RepID=UPI000C9DED59|nr:hypothetical protein [Mangrovicella endophytica]
MSHVTIQQAARSSRAALMISPPLLALGATMIALAAILTLPVTLPLGAFYWDLFIYYDAANRIFSGQVPGVDFFAPVGPLGYWLFASLLKIFPQAQPLLLVNWSLLLVTAPLMAVVLASVGKHSRGLAFALLVPFLLFQILPVNIEQFTNYPGFDGYGIYNRQACHLLYVLTAGLVFCRSQRALFAVVAGAMLALFLVKITGFIAGAMLCLFAFAAGRIGLRAALAAALAFLLSLAALEGATHAVSAYLGDILTLVGMNEGSLAPRFLTAASLHFGVVGAGAALILALLVIGWPKLWASLRLFARRPSLARIASILDRDALWIGVALFAGLFFETQNTGSQAFVFLWPVLLALLTKAGDYSGRKLVLVLSLVAATALPTPVEIVHRAMRALVGQMTYTRLETTDLGRLASVSQRQEVLDRADTMIESYIRYPETYQFIADRGQLPSFTLYSEIDFQIGWLKSADIAVAAIHDYEAAHGVRFETIMSLNFVNPFPWLMQRQAPRYIAIGADPFRAVPTPDERTLAAVRTTDLVLYPKCPITVANMRLQSFYQAALEGRTRVELSPCWDGLVRPELLRANAAAVQELGLRG